MTDLPENELLSAYLDGELTAQEQAQVEQLLATSAAARQLLDELRTLSSTLQALPVHKPGVDLSQRVLRAAERQILSGGDVRPERDEPPPEQVPSPASIVGRDLWKRLLRPRSLLWAAAIFLVALFLHLWEAGPPNPPAARLHDGQQIAMAPAPGRVEEPPSIHAPEKPAPRREVERATMASPPAGKTLPTGETGSTVGLPNRDLRTAGQAGSGTHALAEEEEGVPGSTFGNRQPAAPSGQPMASGVAPSEMPALPGLGAGGGKPGATVASPDGDFRTAGQAGKGAPAVAKIAERADVSAAAPPGGRDEKAAADDLALRAKGGENQLARTALQSVPQMPSAPPAAAPRPAKGSLRALKGEAAKKVLLVECEVTLHAAREHVFEKMLADQQLSGKLADYRRRGAMAGQGAAEDHLAAGKSADASDRRSLPEAAKKDADKVAGAAKVEALEQSGPAGPAEKRAQVAETRSFVVEATPQQLGAILQRLKARREDFPSVTSSPEVKQLRYQGERAASDGVKQKQVDEGRFAAPATFGMGGSIQYQGMAAKAGPAPASPRSVLVQKAAVADRPREESQRQNLGEPRKSLASQQGNAAEQEKTPQAAPPTAGLTLMPSTASVSASGQPPGSALGGQLGGQPAPTYRVRFVLRVVSPAPSAAGNALTDRAPQSAEPAESKPADPAAEPAPVAAPAAAPSK